MRAGDLPEAAKYLREAIRLVPTEYAWYFDLAAVEYLNGNSSVAKETLDRAVQILPSSGIFRVGNLAYLHGLVGAPDQAAKLLARLEEILKDSQRENWHFFGWEVLGTRDKARALREWRMTVDGYLLDDRPVSPGAISRFRDNWLSDPMLEEPEFLKLRRRLGFKG